jgi:hypothetical protein
MDNPATLLTAIMFVTVLGMGIGNLLMACADIAGGLRQPRPARIQLSWIVLLLLAMLNLFWEATAILDVEDWEFLDFLYMILGPMVLLFAAGVIIAPVAEREAPQAHYLSMSGRFFLMLAVQEAWLLGLDVQFDMLSLASVLDGTLLILFVVLSLSKNYRLHLVGNVIAWAGFVAPLPLRMLGL